ncbi:BRI1 kinase inhibitor 1-like protein [Cinnamomum micranthum f. kanehirae]|uniref:BRI1 kinase inhibitor 1-like protein n=1 Tax=Cinnamomum micranthum f. kanehirae TaxID=337451 RepID=A0A443PH12_9MAGN|nr:BRI1 kinase inhibitor 1-like protein [Cinnamomum micranthum f. kanehirae]
MATPQQQNKIHRGPNKEGGEKEGELSPKHQKLNSPTIQSLPPSSTSSPSHEFSFTISLHPTTAKSPDKCKSPPSFAIDLSPADDIFFHGHLLPLQLFSRVPISPRNSNSTTSLDNLNHPSRDLMGSKKANKSNSASATKDMKKSKSFSMFGLAKWRKALDTEEDREDKKRKKKKKASFNVGGLLKRYMRLIKPLFFSKGGGEKEKREFRRQPYSLSGNLNWKWKERGGRRGGEFSAPASLRTSPTNSGLLFTTPAIASPSQSTMEELQNAIQAAIAHCKNSIAAKEENCQMLT